MSSKQPRRHRRVDASDRPVPQVALSLDRLERDAVLIGFGENLKCLRATVELSQADVAARSFLRSSHISALERGIRAPTLPVLLMLASALGTSVRELTANLTAPTRAKGRQQVLSEIERHHGATVHVLAASLELPMAYLTEMLRYLHSSGEISGPGEWTLARPEC
jgi:transcriptional regulator with XRE-family HTH domain